ncbi:type IV pilus biogenesis/stability protein PilW [Chitinibacteraceae bacterium HSL-7]
MPMRMAAIWVACATLAGTALADGDEDKRSPSEIRTQLAAEYLRFGQYATAISEADKAISADKNYAPAFEVRALTYAAIHEDASARGDFQRAVTLEPNNGNINHNFGWFLCDRGDFAAGITYYEKAASNPLYQLPDKSLVGAGLCAAKMGNTERQLALYKQALTIRPRSVLARAELAEYWIRAGDAVEAKRYYLELRRMLPESAPLLWLGIRVEHLAKNRGLEQQLASDLRSKFPDSLEATKLSSGRYD